MYQEDQNNRAQNQANEDKYVKIDQEFRRALEDVRVLKEKIGYPFENVGTSDSGSDEESVMGALNSDMTNYGGDPQQKTVSATLEKLYTDLTEVRAKLAQKNLAYDEQQTNYLSLDKIQQELRQEIDDARAEAEKLRQLVQETKESELASKVAVIDQTRNQLNETIGRLDEVTRLHEALKKESKEKYDRQRTMIRLHAEEIQELKHVDFETPDGKIVWTSQDKRLVWINLGSSDRLPRRMTFSVYKKQHNGVARGKADIKGSIEITKIKGPHLAVARVVEADIFMPIFKGDPIYTPLWSPGRSENFAIVGFIDLDGDGKSDRDKLRDIIIAAGSNVVAEILEDGTTIPKDADFNRLISENVKFVIKGVLPDPASTNIKDEQVMIQRVLAYYKTMREAALDNGVRIASLSDFLSFIGHKVERRLYRPGDKSGYRLKNGSRSASVDETISRIGDQSSNGVAGRYARHPLLRKKASTGQTSKRFSGGSGK